MPITFDTLKVAIHHTLGGDPSAGASYARIINGAGRAWTAAQDWYYLGGRLATLTATPNSEWIALPADYQSFVSLTPVGEGFASLALVSPARFIEIAENGTVGHVSSYIYTIQYRDVMTDVAPWVRLYPTPSIADEFTLLYDAQWADVNEDEDVIPVPKFAEHAFEEWVRMYARGMDEEDSEPLAVRMANLKASPLFLDVARRDALVTGGLVPPGRGAAQRAIWGPSRYLPDGDVV
jgi:hypothetical protein